MTPIQIITAALHEVLAGDDRQAAAWLGEMSALDLETHLAAMTRLVDVGASVEAQRERVLA